MSDKTHREQTFHTQIGTKATVQRLTVGAEQAALPNRALADLGLACHPVPGKAEYMGSAAVHIYWNATLEQVFFVSQTAALELYHCPEILAIKASEDLVQAMKVTYGKKRLLRRSGF